MRWPAVGVSCVFVLASFYLAYRKRPTRRNKIVAWLAALAAAAALTLSLMRP
jgi:hypothetical protein